MSLYFKRYSTLKFRTSRSFDDNRQKAVIDFLLYFRRDSSSWDSFLEVHLEMLKRRNEVYHIYLNRVDILEYIGPKFEEALDSHTKMLALLESFASKLVLKRRHVYKRIEIVLHRMGKIQVSLANEFRYSRDKKALIEKKNHESVLISHFVHRLGKEFMVVSVLRHTTQEMFEVRVHPRKSLKKYSFHLSYQEISDLINTNSSPLLPYEYPIIQFLAFHAKNAWDLESLIKEVNREEIAQKTLKAHKRTIGLDKLNPEQLNQRILMHFVWQRVVARIELDSQKESVTTLSIFSFSSILPQYLVSRFWPLGGNKHFWIDIKVSKNAYHSPFTPLDGTISPSRILDLELYIGTREVPSMNISSEKVKLRDALEATDPILAKISSGQFRLSDLQTVAIRLHDYIVDGVEKSQTVSLRHLVTKKVFKKKPQPEPPIKLLWSPFMRKRKGFVYLAADSIPLVEASRILGRFPVLMITRLLVARPRKLVTVVQLNQEDFVFVIQDLEGQTLCTKVWKRGLIEGEIPFFDQLITAKLYAMAGDRMIATYKNRLLVYEYNFGNRDDIREEESWDAME